MTEAGFSLITRVTNIVLAAPEQQKMQPSRVEDYLNKTNLLKQIMSNKARAYRHINAAQNVATVVASSFLLFFGFSGIPKIKKYVSWIYPIGTDGTELAFNLLVFLLFIIGTLHLLFRFPQKESDASKAVAALAALANEIEDMITSRGNLVISSEPLKVDLIRSKYESIALTIPSNSDREFHRARRDLKKKQTNRPQFHVEPQDLFDKTAHEKIVSAIILGSSSVVEALITLRKVDKRLYLGGGIIRNAVWDYLHGFRNPTAVDDVDVIYFDKLNCQKQHDLNFEADLAAHIPNAVWSVKNQARMHVPNNEQPYHSVSDAVSKWPETATAVAVRLDDAGKLEFISPFGFDDLLRLIVTPTPHFAANLDIVRNRMTSKQWQMIWPRLKLIIPPAYAQPQANPNEDSEGKVETPLPC